MTFRAYYLFYLLTIFLIVLGLLTKDVETISASWHTTIIKGMWSFFIPTSICSLLIGLIYNYRFTAGRPVRKGTIVLHFTLVALGLIFSLNFYRLTIILLTSGAPDTTAIASEDSSFIFLFLGPVLFIASFIVFIGGLLNTKRTMT